MSRILPSAWLRAGTTAFLEQAEANASGAQALSRLVQLATARLLQEELEQEQRIAITPLEHARLQQLYQERGLRPAPPPRQVA
jgi:hypothetical protein